MRKVLFLVVILYLCGCDPVQQSRRKLEALKQSEKYETGIACMQYISKYGDDLAYSKTLINKLFSIGFFDQAIYAAEILLKKFPEDAELFYLRGVGYRKQHQYSLATLDLNKAVDLQPQNKTYLSELKSVKDERGVWDEIETLNKSLVNSTDSFSVLLNRAEKFFNIQQYDAALYDLGSISTMRTVQDSVYFTEKVADLYTSEKSVEILSAMLKYFQRREETTSP
ncbi:MAG TPA: hypothetical protein VFD46_07900 [Chryseolinea sp.]|nr:hypothetical protein [Chryseolinea sp.]